MKTVLFDPEAELETEKAVTWYEERAAGLGVRLLREVDRTVDLIRRFPKAGAGVPGVAHDLGVRRVPFDRFPFQMIFLEAVDTIWILAVAHDRRRPRYWIRRIREGRRPAGD